jgi:hypothetical protein
MLLIEAICAQDDATVQEQTRGALSATLTDAKNP